MVSDFKSAAENSLFSQNMHQGGSGSVNEGSRESKLLKEKKRDGREGKGSFNESLSDFLPMKLK